ncbi:MAG: hypothetical protein JXQ73_13365 [Phycisphaerae bacterium]|nr:hypothetical protein [Phycisphaerae bacterium]
MEFPRRLAAVGLLFVLSLVARSPGGAIEIGKTLPLIDVLAPDGTPVQAVLDGKIDTGFAVASGAYSLRRGSTEPAVFLAINLTARDKGNVVVKCDDVMTRTIAYGPGQRWHRTRLPYSAAKRISVTWDKAGPTWNEVRLLGRTPLPARPAGSAVETKHVQVNVSGGSSTPTCDMPPGFMCSWFERGLTDGMTKPAVRQEFIQRLREFPVGAIRYPGGAMTYGYPPTRQSVKAFIDAKQEGGSTVLQARCMVCHGVDGTAHSDTEELLR